MQLTVILAVLVMLWAGEAATEVNGESVLMAQRGWVNSLILLVGTVVLMWSVMRLIANKVQKKLMRSGFADSWSQRLPGRVELAMRVIVLLVFAAQLTVGGWAVVVRKDWNMAGTVALDEILLILPFVVMESLKWYCFYPVNRFVRENIMMGQLSEGLAARPVWTRRQYMSFHIRHGMLIMLIPMLLILSLKDGVDLAWGHWFAAGIEPAADELNIFNEGLVGLGAGVIFLLAPLLLRRIWLTRSLPGGPLRERLEEFCRQIKLKYRDILLWDTYSAVANAAVMGLIRPLRYVLLSDALIENMSDEQIEAVFGHEAGHVKQHHIFFLLLFFANAMFLMFLLFNLMSLLPEKVISQIEDSGEWGEWMFTGFTLILMGGWLILFGWLSRRFERQADVHGAWVVGNEGNPAGDTSNLSEHGVMVMSAALRRIALLNGVSMASRSWRHSSLNSRVAFLQQLARQPNGLKKFNRFIRIIKLLMIFVLVAAVAGGYIMNRGL